MDFLNTESIYPTRHETMVFTFRQNVHFTNRVLLTHDCILENMAFKHKMFRHS
jgi:hypothetical protein